MEAHFKKGQLFLVPESELEQYALEQWRDNGAETTILPFDTTDEVEETAIAFIKDSQFLGAVKAVKELTGWGLKEAKEYCDKIRDNLKN
jgi:ribosomal protein L7/L12